MTTTVSFVCCRHSFNVFGLCLLSKQNKVLPMPSAADWGGGISVVLHSGSTCLLSREIDGCILRHSTTSSCQSAATSKIVKRCCSRVFSCKQRYIKYPDLYLNLYHASWAQMVALMFISLDLCPDDSRGCSTMDAHQFTPQLLLVVFLIIFHPLLWLLFLHITLSFTTCVSCTPVVWPCFIVLWVNLCFPCDR